jgi:trehalose/maltose hydrolase-like predicted phosphorylase
MAELNGWSLVYRSFDPTHERTREALFALGNGRFVTRAALPWAEAEDLNEKVSYPGCYRAGLYNRLTSQLDTQQLEHEELVNLCNWLPVRMRFMHDGTSFRLRDCRIVEYRQELDLAHGLMTRALRVLTPSGAALRIRERRLAHMVQTELAALELTIESEDFVGDLELSSVIDAQVRNRNADEYAGLDDRHLSELTSQALDVEYALVRACTRTSRIAIALATRSRLRYTGARLSSQRSLAGEAGAGSESVLALHRGSRVQVEKLVALCCDRDVALHEPGFQAERALRDAPDFAALCASQSAAWQHLWQRWQLHVDGHPHHTTALRLHMFHILQTISPRSCDVDASVPARGWHGENYHGHVFWDELFVFPILNFRFPELARTLLLYRCRRLDEARRAARAAGFRGAMFPWRSASDGRDVSERLRLNPQSKRWIADHSHLQRHVNAAIVYNVWEYYQVTGDDAFLEQHGAELVLEIARFWASAASFDSDKRRYVLHGVVGPDEFHDAYPDAAQPGLDNSAYTNVMAAWTILRALDVLALLPAQDRAALRERLALGDEELARWRDVSARMFVPFVEDGIIEQFEGFSKLALFDWQGYRARYGDIHRLDNILEAEGDTANRYQICKQADVLMLFYLFCVTELTQLFAQLGYDFDARSLRRNTEFYLQRTAHGSTLSRVVHAWALSCIDPAHSWRFLEEALGTDLADIQGGTTAEGVHLGAMAGTIDVFQRRYLGLSVREDALWLDPHLPDALDGMSLRLCYRGEWLDFAVSREQVVINAQPDGRRALTVYISGERHRLEPGQQLSHVLQHEH